MKTVEQARTERLIKEAHSILDRVEATLRFIVESAKPVRKAA